MSDDNKDLSEYESDFVVFDDMLDCNQKANNPILTGGRHEQLDVPQGSQSNFDLLKRIEKKTSKRKT